MTSRRAILLVAVRDFRERVASRAFQLSTAVTLLFVAAIIVVPALFFDDDVPEWKIGVVGETPAGFAVAVETASGNAATVTTIQYADRTGRWRNRDGGRRIRHNPRRQRQ